MKHLAVVAVEHSCSNGSEQPIHHLSICHYSETSEQLILIETSQIDKNAAQSIIYGTPHTNQTQIHQLYHTRNAYNSSRCPNCSKVSNCSFRTRSSGLRKALSEGLWSYNTTTSSLLNTRASHIPLYATLLISSSRRPHQSC